MSGLRAPSKQIADAIVLGSAGARRAVGKPIHSSGAGDMRRKHEGYFARTSSDHEISCGFDAGDVWYCVHLVVAEVWLNGAMGTPDTALNSAERPCFLLSLFLRRV